MLLGRHFLEALLNALVFGLARFDFFLFLLDEFLRNSVFVLLSGIEQRPKFAHEDSSVFAVEEPGEVDLHLPRVHVLNVLELVEDEFDDDVVLEAEKFRDAFRDPRP